MTSDAITPRPELRLKKRADTEYADATLYLTDGTVKKGLYRVLDDGSMELVREDAITPEGPESKVTDLMAALEESLAAAKKARDERAAASPPVGEDIDREAIAAIVTAVDQRQTTLLGAAKAIESLVADAERRGREAERADVVALVRSERFASDLAAMGWGTWPTAWVADWIEGASTPAQPTPLPPLRGDVALQVRYGSDARHPDTEPAPPRRMAALPPEHRFAHTIHGIEHDKQVGCDNYDVACVPVEPAPPRRMQQPGHWSLHLPRARWHEGEHIEVRHIDCDDCESWGCVPVGPALGTAQEVPDA